MMFNWKLKLVSIVLMIVLGSLVYVQFRLNRQLSSDLKVANDKIEELNKNITESVNSQSDITKQLNDLKIEQYNSQQELKRRLHQVKMKPPAEQKIDFNNETNSILSCIETISLGKQCQGEQNEQPGTSGTDNQN